MKNTLILLSILIVNISNLTAQKTPTVNFDFENCSIDQSATSIQCDGKTYGLDGVGSYTPIITTAQNKSGNNGLRIELKNDEYLGRNNTYRSEIELHRFFQNDIDDRNAFYLGFWIYIPSDFPTIVGWQAVAQYKQTAGTNYDPDNPTQKLSLQPPCSIEMTAGNNPRFTLAMRGDNRSTGVSQRDIQEDRVVDIMEVPKDQWTHFVIYTKFDPQGNGRVTVWANGIQKVDLTGKLGYENGDGIQTRIGMYRSKANHSDAWVVYDDIKLDYTFDLVAELTGVSVFPTSLNLQVGDTHSLKATVLPADAENKAVTWSSGNTTVATVNADGMVTAVSTGTATIMATTVKGETANCMVTVLAPQKPYGDIARNIPGTIEAEDYDMGGEGFAYHDTSAGNSGDQYRTDDVDIELRDGNYNLGWVSDGEWLEYTVNTSNDIYDMEINVATPVGGTSIIVSLDEAVLGTFEIPHIGGWGDYQTLKIPNVPISEGKDRILRIKFVGGNMGLNWISFTPKTLSNSTVFDLRNKDKVLVYPNPFQNNITVSLGNHDVRYLSIIDIHGKVIFTKEIKANTSEVSLDLNTRLSKGTYFITTMDEKQVVKAINVITSK